MIVGIHIYPKGSDDSFVKKYAEILEFNNIKYVWLDINDISFWEKIRYVNYFIYRWIQWDDHHQIAKSILPVIEHYYNIKCLPDLKSCWHYDDKIREYYLMKAFDFPIIKSWVFYDKRSALDWTEKEMRFPVVFKLKGGAGSEGVLRVDSLKDAKKLVSKMFGSGFISSKLDFKGSLVNTYCKRIRKYVGNCLKRTKGQFINFNWQRHKNYILFQEFMPNNEFDTRVTIIGKRAFCFRRFNRKNDFRSSGSGILDYDQSAIDLNFITLAFKISTQIGFQTMAYDFLYDEEKNPVFCEISYTYVDKAVYNCPGFWDNELKFHPGHFWPQYFNLVDLLEKSSLLQPN
jgi:glutathione synthase/RimK-type ligase-like ATP-grasp enzyme